jgi:putative addiction module component (TIGR02574 family)
LTVAFVDDQRCVAAPLLRNYGGFRRLLSACWREPTGIDNLPRAKLIGAEDVMNDALKVLGIDRLDVTERLALIEEIWDSIEDDSPALSLTQAQREELDRRLATHDSAPERAIDWDTAQATLAQKLGL